MIKIEGWILDAGINQDFVQLWIKMENGKVVPALYRFYPSFYAQFKESTSSFDYVNAMISQHENIIEIERCKKFVYVYDNLKSDVFKIKVDSPRNFKKTIKDLEKTDQFNLYNTDVPVAQMFFYEMDLFPMGLCEFELEMIGTKTPKKLPKGYPKSPKELPKIKNIILKDSNEAIFYKTPTLKIIELQLGEFGKRCTGKKYRDRFTKPKRNDRLISCNLILRNGYNVKKIERSTPPWMLQKTKNQLLIEIDRETESDTIEALSREIKYLDPDIILSNHGDEYFFPYLISRASANHCNHLLSFSRDGTTLRNNLFQMGGDTSFFSYGQVIHRSKKQIYLKGRVHIDNKTHGSLHFSDGNIAGIIEIARVSRIPIQRLTRITIGGSLQSIQFYVAGKKDYLIPPEKKNSEDFQLANTLLLADRGGHIFEPLIGVFERVGEFDFTSMYPMIMRNYNISPDTINCDCCIEDGIKVPGLPFHTCIRRKGIVGEALRVPLNKRRVYKRMKDKVDPKIAKRFDKMSAALKWILVVSFGYLGFKNARFGRVEGHQAVCAYARELLLHSQEIAEERNYRVIHGIVDSMWLQDLDYPVGIVPDKEKNGSPKIVGVTHFTKKQPPPEILKAQLDNFNQKGKELAEKIRNDVDIPIKLDATYKFIVFLPSQAHADIPVLNHYWAVTYDNKVKVRGIELRRRDAPNIVKQCQKDLIDILSSVANIYEFMDKLPEAKRKLDEYYHRIDSGKVDANDLVIINRVSRKAGDYKVKSYQAVASERLLAKGIEIQPGQNVEYIIKDASSKNPNKRIILRSEFQQYNRTYDKNKYKELLQRGFRNIIPFDYDKIIDYNDANLGNSTKKMKPKEQVYGLDRFLTQGNL